MHTFVQQLCVSHDEVQKFEWKRLQNDDVTLKNSIANKVRIGENDNTLLQQICEFIEIFLLNFNANNSLVTIISTIYIRADTS